MARLGKGSSPWGGVLDWSLAESLRRHSAPCCAALPTFTRAKPDVGCDLVVNLCVFLEVRAASEGQREKVIVCSPGLVKLGEALFFAIFAGFFPEWTALVRYVYAGLEVRTAYQRFLAGKRELNAL